MVPLTKLLPDATEGVIVLTPQLSVAVGDTKLTFAAHIPGLLFTVLFAGQAESTGASISITVTLNEQVELLDARSTAVYVTNVVPLGNVMPDVCVLVVAAIEQLSITIGLLQLAGPLQFPGVVLAVTVPGQNVNVGP